jgi:hypothetical protein
VKRILDGVALSDLPHALILRKNKGWVEATHDRQEVIRENQNCLWGLIFSDRRCLPLKWKPIVVQKSFHDHIGSHKNAV